MATWKKIITSGSIAELAQITASTEIQAASVDINGGTLDNVVIGGGTAAAASVTSLDVANGNITNVGDIDADSISIADAANGLNIDFGAANTGTSKLTLRDNMADALNVLEGSNSYIKIVTTNSSEQIVFGQNSTFSGTTIADLGTVTTANIDGGTIDGTKLGSADGSGYTRSTAAVTVTGSFTGSYYGDGSGLTGVGTDIDGLDELDATPHATEDEFLISDDGTEKRISMTNVAKGVFAIADDGDDATIAADGGITINNDAVTLAKMAGLARGKFIVGDASGNPSALAAGANGKILVADANGDPSFTTLSGDATLSAGALTISDNKIGNSELKQDDDITLQSLTTTANVNVGGDLTVDGDLKTVSTSNIETGDRLIFLASGSHNVGEGGLDAGIMVQSGSAAGTGSALYHDISEQRWAVAKNITASGSLHIATVPTSHLVTVTTNTSTPSGDGEYGIGEMHIDSNAAEPTGDGVIYIRTN